MGIVRKSKFGFPVRQPPGSVETTRLVPLTQGVQGGTAWPIQTPGSAGSMLNYLPLDGVLVPRSRLSSCNTVRTFQTGDFVSGVAALTRADFAAASVWVSGQTRHGIMTSNGSVSMASFVSAFGLGISGLPSGTRWQYTQTYMANLGSAGDNALLAVPRGLSANTILALYQTSGSPVGLPLFSYLTSAPQTVCVGAWNDYIMAFSTKEGGIAFPSRVRWNVRGQPSNWTGEGSGFEDLLEMRGTGQAIVPTVDGRVLLFSDLETWYAVSATYPAQFDFQPFDHEIGCPFPETIERTDQGLVFVGSDHNLRLLPGGGGKSQIIVPGLAKQFRYLIGRDQPTQSWALYDPILRLYHLFIDTQSLGGGQFNFVVNVGTGEWGWIEYNPPGAGTIGLPIAGVVGRWPFTTFSNGEGMFFVNSIGTIFSSHSRIPTENGSGVTSTWQSAPLSAELPGNYKQLTKVCLDYRATSKSTLTLLISQDGGNTYEATGQLMSLPTAANAGRVEKDVYAGGAFPAIRFTSQSTGYELHRVDVGMNLGGRK